MKNALRFAIVVLLLSVVLSACGAPAQTGSAPPTQANTNAETPTLSAVEAATATFTVVPVSSPTSTPSPLELEVIQSQVWTDRDENVRTNVLVRNPYEFPVKIRFRGHASLFDSAGELVRGKELYFLDGISGGNGFLLPGETVAANACFTCEEAPLSGEWSSVGFRFSIEDATETWDYSTEVEASVGNVAFSGDSPIFDVSGTVNNNSDSALDRISVRIFVYDQEGKLVGAAEASAWDVGAGASASFTGYGIGQAPDGPVTSEVTVLGVTY
jgi:hypothetical protein